MLDENGNMDEATLAKFLLEETTEQERLVVEAWLQASAENRRHFEQLQKLWQESAGSSSKFDTDAAWSKLSEHIDNYGETLQKQPVVRSLQRPRFTWIAAAVVVALTGLFGLFQYYFNSEIKLVANESMLEQKLPDGSTVALNTHSQLYYSKEFEGEIRKVELRGEAFFEVEPNPEKPFVIEVGAGRVKVLGTSFNVEAYKNRDLKVQVVTGRVQLSSQASNADMAMVILTAGEIGIIDQKTGRFYKEIPLYEDASFWLNKKLVFKKTPLPTVLEVLEKNYKTRFVDVDKKLLACLLTARFEGESLEAILEVISATFDIRFEIGEKQVQVTSEGNNCVES